MTDTPRLISKESSIYIGLQFQNRGTSATDSSKTGEAAPRDTVCVFLGDKDKHKLATRNRYFHQLALLQAYTISSVQRAQSIKIITLVAGGQLKTVSWHWSKYLSLRVSEVSVAFILKISLAV